MATQEENEIASGNANLAEVRGIADALDKQLGRLAEAAHDMSAILRIQKQTTTREYFLETGKSLMALANIAAGALLFGQAFSVFPFNLRIASVGVIMVLGLYAFAWYLMRGGERR
jgi:hypothetical protein